MNNSQNLSFVITLYLVNRRKMHYKY